MACPGEAHTLQCVLCAGGRIAVTPSVGTAAVHGRGRLPGHDRGMLEGRRGNLWCLESVQCGLACGVGGRQQRGRRVGIWLQSSDPEAPDRGRDADSD